MWNIQVNFTLYGKTAGSTDSHDHPLLCPVTCVWSVQLSSLPRWAVLEQEKITVQLLSVLHPTSQALEVWKKHHLHLSWGSGGPDNMQFSSSSRDAWSCSGKGKRRTGWRQIMWNIKSSSGWLSQTKSWKCNWSVNCMSSALPSAAAGPCPQSSAQVLRRVGNSSVLCVCPCRLPLSTPASCLHLPSRMMLWYSPRPWLSVAVLVESTAALWLL